MSPVIIPADDAQIHTLLSSGTASSLYVLNFWASWAEPCTHMNEVFAELSAKHPDVRFIQLEAENHPEVSEKFEIASVPTFVLLQGETTVSKIEGANAALLSSSVASLTKKLSSAPKPSIPNGTSSEPKVDLDTRLKSLISQHPVMLFMKGTPQEPRCGFSRQTVEILNNLNVDYKTFNILADEEVRAGLKEFSKWPTYPQIYVNGELIGGLDILKEMVESGDFQQMVPKVESLNDKLKRLINQAPVMIFVKGSPSEPKCGFSRTLMTLFADKNIKFESFDILTDEEVRQGLKTYSNWPTYPQVYINGELVGGLDIIKELDASGELEGMIPK
ncbi:Glutaredoxin 3 [Nowakowskiella sp. JEL0407]|nr:Glutaredoxin 3 [Nowakowskiella sp. JEL0407]